MSQISYFTPTSGPGSGTVTSVSGGNNITITGVATVNPTVNVSGTTNHSVLLGNATNSISSLANGTTGQVLHAITGANDPVWSAVSLTADVSGVLPIANGGTNANAMATTFGVNYFDGTRIVTTAVGTATHVLTSNGAGVAPTFQPAAVSGVTWTVITVNQTIVVNNGYITNKAGTLSLLLPATAVVGDIIKITGIQTAASWQITQNANQQIFLGAVSTTIGVGGSVTATAVRDSIELVCVVAGASTVFNAINFLGNLTVV